MQGLERRERSCGSYSKGSSVAKSPFGGNFSRPSTGKRGEQANGAGGSERELRPVARNRRRRPGSRRGTSKQAAQHRREGARAYRLGAAPAARR